MKRISRAEALRISKRTLLRAEASRKPPRKRKSAGLERVECPQLQMMLSRVEKEHPGNRHWPWCICRGHGYLWRKRARKGEKR